MHQTYTFIPSFLPSFIHSFSNATILWYCCTCMGMILYYYFSELSFVLWYEPGVRQKNELKSAFNNNDENYSDKNNKQTKPQQTRQRNIPSKLTVECFACFSFLITWRASGGGGGGWEGGGGRITVPCHDVTRCTLVTNVIIVSSLNRQQPEEPLLTCISINPQDPMSQLRLTIRPDRLLSSGGLNGFPYGGGFGNDLNNPRDWMVEGVITPGSVQRQVRDSSFCFGCVLLTCCSADILPVSGCHTGIRVCVRTEFQP